MQNTVSFFKVNGNGHALPASPRGAMRQAHHLPQIARLGTRPAARESVARGVHLEMGKVATIQTDHKDAEFEKF